MSKLKTAKQYAIDELRAERFPQIWIFVLGGEFHLTDKDDHLLADRTFSSRIAAEQARSKALSAASKVVNR